MRDQVRMYRLRQGSFDEFLAKWREHIVPLREKMGFSIPAAWHHPETNEFIWVVRWEGEGSFEDADRAYYEARERSALPTRFEEVETQDARMWEPIAGSPPA